MRTASFDDWLQAARQQAEPQHLLFAICYLLFVLPVRRRPVNKPPAELNSFFALERTSQASGSDWAIVFPVARPDSGGKAAHQGYRREIHAADGGRHQGGPSHSSPSTGSTRRLSLRA